MVGLTVTHTMDMTDTLDWRARAASRRAAGRLRAGGGGGQTW